MSNLEIIHSIGICLLMACALWYRHKYLKAERLRQRQHFEDDMNYQIVNGRYLHAIKELAATKAELEFTNKVYTETQKKLHKSNYTIDSLHKENDKLQAELKQYKNHNENT
jgi:septal ring factor EnvC (AmiA/AmiB activator)